MQDIFQIKLKQMIIKQKKSPFQRRFYFGDPRGIRTPVTAVKGRCPRPLDDGVCLKAWSVL